MRIELEKFLPVPKRPRNSHKGTFGKVLNIAGSKRFSGAAVLSSLAVLKTGAGYVTLACPEEIVSSVASYSPDITFFPLDFSVENNNFSELICSYDALSLGCGLTAELSVTNFVLSLLKEIQVPSVIDADALNILADSEIKNFDFPAVMTPHPKELSRLMRVSIEDIQNNREEYCVIAAKKYNAVCVLKGHNTVVSDGKDVYINTTGNSALAKAGSGDVLTGIISGLAAQGCSMFQAAVLGVYLHGISGELASYDMTEYSVLASDLLKYIPFAIKKII